MLFIKNAHIKTMAGVDLENGCILIDSNGKIAQIAEHIEPPAEATVVDAQGRLVTPGCVEAHCHIGLHDAGLRWEGLDVNESTDPVTPHMRAIDAIYPQDDYLKDAIRGGVTTACTGPGSANVVGGTFAVIKLHGERVDDMIVKFPAAMKCALGENPKNCYGQSGSKTPKTRMASAALLRELLMKAKAYCAEKDAGENPKFDMKLEAMLPVMHGEIPMKCHVHRADDILTAIRIAKEFGVKLTIDHCTDGACIAEILATEGYPVIAGPALTGKTKPEMNSKSFATPGILHKAGVNLCITTDAPVSTLENLPLCAGLAASEGLPMEEAWKAVTINPARILGVDDRIGSLEPGKDADIVIWTADPLTTIGGRAHITIVNGKIVYHE